MSRAFWTFVAGFDAACLVDNISEHDTTWALINVAMVALAFWLASEADS